MVAIIVGIALTLISAVGLFLNGYIIVIIIVTKQPVSANSVLLLHLGAVGALLSGAALSGAADGALGALGAPGATAAAAAPSVAGGAACVARAFLLVLLHPVQLWTVCALHADRCAAIAAPLHYAAMVNPKKVMCALAGSWAVSVALSAPVLLSRPALLRPALTLAGCAPDCAADNAALAYCVAYTAITLLIPAALIFVCNLKILMIARYHRHRIASAIYEVTLSAQVTITHQRNPFYVPALPPAPPKVRSRSALSSIIQLLGSLVLLYFPYYGVLVWRSAAAPPNLIVIIATTLLSCAPPINGLLYGVRSKPLRKSFQNYWRKKMTKSEMSQEIQARTPSTCGSRRPSLTPLGFLTRPRRMSDAGGLKRIASDQSWRDIEGTTPRAASCNTLQVPSPDGERISRNCAIPFPRPTTNMLLQKVFGLESSKQAKNRSNRPRIKVTRAMSDDSEAPSPGSIRKPVLTRQQSRSSAALLQRLDDSDGEVIKEEVAKKRQAMFSVIAGDSCSSSSSEDARPYFSMEAKGRSEERDRLEEQLPLTWPAAKGPPGRRPLYQNGNAIRNGGPDLIRTIADTLE